MDSAREEFLRTKAYPFYDAVRELIRLMAAERKDVKPGGERPEFLSECRIKGEGYDIRFVLRNRGIRPFLALMEEPWPHKVYLGRLKKGGKAHAFEEGVKVFFNFLILEEVLDRVLTDLRAAVAEWAALRAPRDAKPRGCPLAGQGCGQGGCGKSPASAARDKGRVAGSDGGSEGPHTRRPAKTMIH